MKNNRFLKVYGKVNFCQKHLVFSDISSQIILQGRWLKEAGFNFGDSVKVHVENKKLVITQC